MKNKHGFKEGDIIWVKTRVCYISEYDDGDVLGLDSVTLWDIDSKMEDTLTDVQVTELRSNGGADEENS